MNAPLEGVRVIDLCTRLNGSYCTMLLGDLGAEVIKVERPGMTAAARQEGVILPPTGRNKKSLTLNLKSKEAKKIFSRLVEKSDVVVSAYLPEIAQKLQVDYSNLNNINKNIIYCSITGYGQDGPYKDRPSHDVDCLGVSGVLSIPGDYHTHLQPRPGLPIGTLSANVFAVTSILAALLVRPKLGRGQFIDVSAAETLLSFASVRAGKLMIEGAMPERNEWLHISPTTGVYETKDGKQFIIGLVEETLWENFCEACGRVDLLEDERFTTASARNMNYQDLCEILKELFLTKTRDEWTKIMENARICFSPVNDLEEAFMDRHFNNRGMVGEVDFPGIGKIKQITFPVKFSETPAQIKHGPPALGENNKEILTQLGYTIEEVKSYVERGVI
ncbi:MAG TPA: CoA transferase [Desulfobacteraceae bacterium]|nr:CoA transferase [Desulfobacteraceae bacterium]